MISAIVRDIVALEEEVKELKIFEIFGEISALREKILDEKVRMNLIQVLTSIIAKNHV